MSPIHNCTDVDLPLDTLPLKPGRVSADCLRNPISFPPWSIKWSHLHHRYTCQNHPLSPWVTDLLVLWLTVWMWVRLYITMPSMVVLWSLSSVSPSCTSFLWLLSLQSSDLFNLFELYLPWCLSKPPPVPCLSTHTPPYTFLSRCLCSGKFPSFFSLTIPRLTPPLISHV